MAHHNYGSISNTPPEISFGGSRTHHSSINRIEFNQLSEAISSNIFTIQNSGSNLERSLKLLGTRQDSHGLRDRVHVTQMSANQIINQTSQDLIHLASLARGSDRMFRLQVERLKSEFEKSLQRYGSLQKDVARKMKSMVPSVAWEEESQSGISDRQQLLEAAAEERYQKLQELKQVEFEQEMLIEREQRIQQIESDILDVNQIMKELATMVHEQGENINSIENNIDRTYTEVEEGRQQLEKAASHQRTHRKWVCFLAGLAFLVALVVGLVLYFELRTS